MAKVSQEARQAAAGVAPSLHNPLWSRELAQSILDGNRDVTDLVQAFAKFEADVLEKAAVVADNGWSPSYVQFIPGEAADPSTWEPGSPWDRGAVDACKRIAHAIRNLKGEP